MKKTYISPATSVHMLRTRNLIMASPYATLSGNKADNSTVLSRESSNWDDEEDW